MFYYYFAGYNYILKYLIYIGALHIDNRTMLKNKYC